MVCKFRYISGRDSFSRCTEISYFHYWSTDFIQAILHLHDQNSAGKIPKHQILSSRVQCSLTHNNTTQSWLRRIKFFFAIFFAYWYQKRQTTPRLRLSRGVLSTHPFLAPKYPNVYLYHFFIPVSNATKIAMKSSQNIVDVLIHVKNACHLKVNWLQFLRELSEGLYNEVFFEKKIAIEVEGYCKYFEKFHKYAMEFILSHSLVHHLRYYLPNQRICTFFEIRYSCGGIYFKQPSRGFNIRPSSVRMRKKGCF